MRFVGVAVQAFGVGEDGVGEVVVLVNEEIHLLSGTLALRNQIVQLVDGSVLFVQSFPDALRQQVGINFAEEIKTNLAMLIQSLAVIVQLTGNAGEVEVKYQVAVTAGRGMLPDVEVAKECIELVTGAHVVVVLQDV